MVTAFSEPGGSFQYENFVSNEISYQEIMPDLVRIARPGAVYVGVAPEQNFTYIAALQPKMAFIVDVRRQNMLELLMYKALFEMSPDRVEFASRLFSRRPPGSRPATVEAIFRGLESTAGNAQLFQETLQTVKDRLEKQHGFSLTAEDKRGIDKGVYGVLSGRAPDGLRVPEPDTEQVRSQLHAADVDVGPAREAMELPGQRRELREDPADAAEESHRAARRRFHGTEDAEGSWAVCETAWRNDLGLLHLQC